MGRPLDRRNHTAGDDPPVYESFLAAGVCLALCAPSVARRVSKFVPGGLADVLVLGSAVAAADLALVAAERRWPVRPEWSRTDRQTVADAALLFIVSPVEGLIAHAAARAVAQRVTHRSDAAKSPSRRSNGSLAKRVATALLVSEFAHYWHHRLSHECPAMWRFHSVHHQIDRLNWLNSTWFHPFDMVPLMFVQDLPLLIAGIDEDTLLAHRTIKMIHGQLQHANLRGSAPLLGRVFSTTEHHRRHHARDRRVSSSNFGAVLSIWDRLFATFGTGAGISSAEIGFPDGGHGRSSTGERRQRRRP